MIFTDEYLHRVKELMKVGNHITPATQKALLARLEASEEYARYGNLLHGGKAAECVLGKCDMCKAYDAWRKSKGEK